MNRAEFTFAVSKNGKFSKEQAYKAVTAVIETIRQTVSEGEDVEIGCFGTFTVREGEPVFIAGEAFKKAVGISSGENPQACGITPDTSA